MRGLFKRCRVNRGQWWLQYQLMCNEVARSERVHMSDVSIVPSRQNIQPAIADRDLGRVEKYYSWCRSEVLARVPVTAQTVLFVGCGYGITEQKLVDRGCHVVGIERDPHAATQAQIHGIEVIEGDVEQLRGVVADRLFDCLIYADILEHLVDPEAVLNEHVRSLRAGGTVIISVPNFRHWSVFVSLFLRGKITYTDAGIFDRTHLRITSRRTVLEWMKNAGLSDFTWTYTIWRRREKIVSALMFGLAAEFVASQVTLVGTTPHRQGSRA